MPKNKAEFLASVKLPRDKRCVVAMTLREQDVVEIFVQMLHEVFCNPKQFACVKQDDFIIWVVENYNAVVEPAKRIDATDFKTIIAEHHNLGQPHITFFKSKLLSE